MHCFKKKGNCNNKIKQKKNNEFIQKQKKYKHKMYKNNDIGYIYSNFSFNNIINENFEIHLY